jgi:hypothetical protein
VGTTWKTNKTSKNHGVSYLTAEQRRLAKAGAVAQSKEKGSSVPLLVLLVFLAVPAAI